MLEKIHLFSSMSVKELSEIEKITVSVHYKRGEYVFRQGDFSRDFYIIQTGQVELSLRDVFQEHKTIAILKNGEFFGEMALFDKNLSRSLDAQALHNSILLKIPGVDFEQLLSEKPAISFKILGTLSKRLKDANVQKGFVGGDSEKKNNGKVIVVASPRNGYGKTTFSTTLAHLLSNELGKRILYIDLDLYFGDGTYALGVFSPKSILVLAENLKDEIPTWEMLQKYLVKHNENLYILPAPKEFIEGEKVKDSDLATIFKESRNFFDYIVIDTDSAINEFFLTAVDVADQVLFLVDVHCVMSIRSNVRYFRGLYNLNLPPERCALLAIKTGENFNPDEIKKIFKYKVIGALPEIKDIPLDYGQSIYQLAPKSPYCEVLRIIFKTLFKEALLQGSSEKGLFYRLFFPTEPTKTVDEVAANGDLQKGNGLEIANENCSTFLRYIHSIILQGYWDKAFTEAMKLLEIFPNSSEIFQVIGEVCFYQKNFQLGIDALQKTLDLDPKNHYAMGILGIIQLDENMKKKSIEILKNKIQKNPDFPDLHNDLGKLLFSFKDVKGAHEAFQKALELNPKFSEAQVNFAVNFGETQDFPKAIEHLIKVEPKNIRIFYLLGCFLFNMGNFCESFEAFSKVAGENPQYLDVSEKLDSLSRYFHKLSNLLIMHQDLAKSTPNFPDLHYKIGNILVLMGKNEEAIQEFQKALVLNPNYLEAKKKLEEIRSHKSFLLAASLPEILPEKPDDRFAFELSLEKLHHYSDEKIGNLNNFSMMVKNVRSNKEISVKIPFEAFKIGLFSLDCHSVGPIFAKDLLLVQLMDDSSKKIIATFPHVISEDEIKNQRVKQNLASIENPLWSYQFGVDAEFKIPLQYFYVRFNCPHLGNLIGGDDPLLKAEIKNVNTGISARGKCNSENREESYFVLMSENGKEVVREGDKLNFMLTDKQGKNLFSMDFPVLKEDIEEFSKTVSVELLENFLQESPK